MANNDSKHPIRVDLVVYGAVGVALILALASLVPGVPAQIGIISALLGFAGGIVGGYALAKRNGQSHK